MGDLILNSLEIRGFRGFRHLEIERLGRVNLIVGKNNIGKSALLEALQLYAYRGSPDLLWRMLRTHDESKVSFSSRYEDLETQLTALKYLFYGRKDVRTHLEPIQIGPINAPHDTISIAMGWYKALIDEEGVRIAQPQEPTEYNPFDNLVPRLTVQAGNHRVNYPLKVLGIPLGKQITCVFIGADGLDREQFGDMWDNVTLTGLDKEILDSLHILAPGVEGINFRDESTPTATRERERIAIVKVASISEPLPLRSLGDGMQRMLGIALALANAKDGMLLIDEVENGIHYSAQQELWQLIFQLAHRLNIQVFAVAHSWDCMKGFQEAAQKGNQGEGLLIRLSMKKEEVRATLFDEEELEIAIRERIEVR